MSIPYKNIAEIAARNQNTYLAAARLVMEDTYYRGVINKRANEIVTNINSGKVSCHALALWAVSAMNMPLKQ